MVQSFISVSIWFIFFLAIEHLGERPLAVTNIVRNISALLIMVISAFATTAGAPVSYTHLDVYKRQILTR